jgi:DNA replication protein DnaC
MTTPEARATAIRQAINSGFPRRQCEAFRNPDFKYADEQLAAVECISKLIPRGSIIVIRGREGNGKTMIGCSYGYGWYLRNYSLKHGKALYFTQTELLASQKAWYGSGGKGDSPIDRALSCGLLVIDELLTTHESNHDQNMLRDLLDRRYAAKRTTILLTNLDDAGLVNALDRPILDRISDGGALVELRGKSLRGEVA